ncbi:unnamed protein product [Meganyctiphanes norvegica]|uniref:BHLH domain-containing protein n=1 Tax=Meganyctiphanes norvegica TaxID=48144 RepID=A0AAV2SNB6_MEGNR
MIKHAQNFHVSIVNFEIKTRALIRNKSIRKDSPDIICPENLCVAIKKLDRATLLKFGQENFVKVFEDEIEYDHLSMFNRQKGSATFSKDSQSLTFSKSSMSLCSIPSKNKISNVANTTPQTPTDGLELLVINGAKSKPKTQTDDLDLLVSSRRERKRMKIAQKLAFNWFNVIEKSYNSHKNNFEQNNRSKEITTLLHKLEILLPEYKDGDRFLKETILKRASAYCKSLTQCHVLLRREEQELKLEMKKNRIKLVLMKNMQY